MNIVERAAASAALSAMIAVAATTAQAGTANGVVNGDFETGDLTGWSTNCPGAAQLGTGLLGAGDLGIASGSAWGFINGQGSGVTCDLYQDVVIPANATSASLTMRYALTGSNPVDGTETRAILVTTVAGLTLATVQAEVDRGTTRAFAALAAPIDLTAFKGQTVRIRARVENPNNPSVSANVIGLDDVVLTIVTPDPVPTLSQWAMILFSALLAGGAALAVNRRRSAA